MAHDLGICFQRAEQFLAQKVTPLGLGYYPSDKPALEPTLFALVNHIKGLTPDLLEKFSSGDGGFSRAPGEGSGSWMSWAVPLVNGVPAPLLESLKGWILNRFDAIEPGKNFSEKDLANIQKSFGIQVKFNGWPWVDNTASWVEPTALFLISLRGLKLKTHSRIEEGFEMLLDRTCEEGGWNYGNPVQIYKIQPPHPLQTLVVLTSFWVHGRLELDKLPFNKALKIVKIQLQKEPSTLGLAWWVLLQKLLDVPFEDDLNSLWGFQDENGSFTNENYKTAFSLFISKKSSNELREIFKPD